MKKLVFSFASCGNKTAANAAAADSDSVADTAMVDSAADSAAVDTTVAE